jgi:hypothetical protein
VRRTVALLIGFVAVLGTLLVLPVYGPSGPEAVPVVTAAVEVPLGSLDAPAPEAAVQEGPTEPVAGVPETIPTLTVRRDDTDPFSLVGVTWAHDPAVVDVVVKIRVADADGAWGGWTEVTVEDAEQNADADSGAERRGGSAPLWTGPSTGVEAELVTRSGAQPTDVQLDLVDPGTSDADTAMGAPDIQDTADAAIAMPDVHSRAQWGADEGIRTWGDEYAPTLKAATLHHTADSNNYSADQVPAIMRSIYRYHTVSRGWGDIGYNVIVDKFGRLWEGRHGGLARAAIGAHAGGFNTGTFGVSMLGNYETATAPQPMIDSVAAIIAWKFSLFNIDPLGNTRLTSGGGGTAKYAAGTAVTLPTIFGHRDVGSTACPGQYGYAQLGPIRQKAAGLLAGSYNPRGGFDSVSVDGNNVTVRGWATDPDTSGPVTLHVRAAGVVTAVILADQTAEGVEGAHAFNASFPLGLGNYTVCVYAINVGPGTTNPTLGCRGATVDNASFNPRGAFDSVSASGRNVTVTGWATDVDTAGPVWVHAYVDGRPAAALLADQATPTRGAHGYSAVLQLTDGAHTVCTYAINVGRGTTNPHLGCRSVTVTMTPVGALDSIRAVGRQVTVSGWATDPDTPTQPIQVHVYANGRGVAVLNAADASFGGHGYVAGVTLPVGSQNVCTYAINVGQGSSNTHLGCRTVVVSMNPVGALTNVVAKGGHAQVTGWAADPDLGAAPTAVHVYLDGRPLAAIPADATRDGVDGPHAYDVTLPIGGPGNHSICTYAINAGEGTTNPHLGCRSVTTTATDFDPFGTFDPVTMSGPVVTVSGRAGDTDATAPVQLHVYIDGAGAAILLADADPADPAGTRRFFAELTLTTGEHTVCVYAINQGMGTTNPRFGCQEVEVETSAYNPVGELTDVSAAGGILTVSGWAIDPDDEAAAVQVHVYVDGAGAAILSADQVAADVPGPHGFSVGIPLPAGPHRMCAYAINIGAGTGNPVLDCADVVV